MLMSNYSSIKQSITLNTPDSQNTRSMGQTDRLELKCSAVAGSMPYATID
jgi:hypothetical protein